MDRSKRLRRIKAISEYQKLSIAQEEGAITEEDLDKIPRIDPTPDMWGNHVAVFNDPTLEFAPDDIDDTIFRSMNQEWVTLPSVAREKGIPTLYYLDPNKATVYEKYFGIYTPEYGYLHTPATAALNHAIFRGLGLSSPDAKVGGEYNVYWVKTPPDYGSSMHGATESGASYLTLSPAVEKQKVSASVAQMYRAKGKPSLLRRTERDREEGKFLDTDSHSRGVRETSYGTDISPELARKLELLDRGMTKDIESYPRLKRTADALNQTLKARMDALMKEFRSVNRSMNFEDFTKEEMEDIVRQGIMRMFLKRIMEEEGAFSGTELGLPDSYSIK